MVTLAERQKLECGPPERVTLAERQIAIGWGKPERGLSLRTTSETWKRKF